MTDIFPKTEIRKAYLGNKLVIVAPNRAKRPGIAKENVSPKTKTACPFCPKNIQPTNICDELVVDKKWRVASIKNLFPVVSSVDGVAYGTQEVIVENRNHNIEMADLSHRQLKNVLIMYKKRTQEISKDKKINYILCFKNHGIAAGASIIHAHSQVFASQITPPEVVEELSLANKYKNENGVCPHCAILKKEMSGPRKIFENKHVAAFAPYASEFHYESWLFTKRHLDNITQINEDELNSLVVILKKILCKLKKLNLSFNMYLHQVVSDTDQHFYIKIQPRDSIWAGIELGAGLIINSVSPEQAAEYFRN